MGMDMKEPLELKISREKYLSRCKQFGAISMPAGTHFTAGYKAGSALVAGIAKTCAEADVRVIEQSDMIESQANRIEELEAALKVAKDGIEYIIDDVPESNGPWIEACIYHISVSKCRDAIAEINKALQVGHSDLGE